MKSRSYPCFAGLLLLCLAPALRADILLVGEELAGSRDLSQRLSEAKLVVKSAGADALREIDAARTTVAVIASEKLLPPESRIGLTRFLGAGGHVVVVGAQAFDYAPRPVHPVPLVRSAALGRPQRPGTPRGEAPKQETITGPDGKSALSFRTEERGMENFLVEFDAAAARSPKRTVLQFWAKGDSYLDLLAIEIRDTQGKRWLGFVPIGGEWRRYAISLADFLPEGWSNPDEPYPLLEPLTVATIGLGTNTSTLWPEKPMTLALGSVDLAENASGIYTPTSALLAVRLPFFENGMKLPASLFDPFAGTQRVSAHRLRSVNGVNEKPVGAWLCPTPNVEHPGPRMGTDHRKDYVLKFEREVRRIPIWEALDRDGFSAGVVAELRIAAAGRFNGANIALFGLPFATVQSTPALADSLARTIASMASTPKVAGVTINTTAADNVGGVPSPRGLPGEGTRPTSNKAVVPTLRVMVQNPLAREVRGKLVADVGDGRLRGEVALHVPARATASAIVSLSTVPADFPFSNFVWRVAFESDAGRDEWRDHVDVERALIHASRHLIGTQQHFPDGRISHHYFGDAYGVRAMIAYADLLRRQPERMKNNADLWRSIFPATIEASALRFCDMLVRRQNADGSVPMGYGEPSGTYNIADTGSMALGIGQVMPLLKDQAHRENHLRFCRKFVDWAETFYIDEKLSAELTETFPDRAKKGETKIGHYGIGLTSRGRTQTGPSWVLPDILGAQILLTQFDSNPHYRRIAERNLNAYLDGGYTSVGYFHAEALVWGMLTTKEAALQKRIAENLRTTFLAALLKGEANDMYERGARSFLNGLPLLYYRRLVEDNAAVRAVLLKYVWSFASENAPNAMRRVAETFPKPAHGESIAAAKQAACGAIWAMELLEPGSTLLRVVGAAQP
jgi:hypothetical protein